MWWSDEIPNQARQNHPADRHLALLSGGKGVLAVMEGWDRHPLRGGADFETGFPLFTNSVRF
jgi:hypothetical protein